MMGLLGNVAEVPTNTATIIVIINTIIIIYIIIIVCIIIICTRYQSCGTS